MGKKNCWEAKNCGRITGGLKTKEFGVCPVYIETKVNGVNGGVNGGRACWAIAGSLCGGKVQGTFAEKLQNCTACDFYLLVRGEEKVNLVKSGDILAKLG